MQVKLFAGKPDTVERAINRWADDGSRRDVNMMLPLPSPVEGDVAVMIVFTLPPSPGTPRIATPGRVN